MVGGAQHAALGPGRGARDVSITCRALLPGATAVGEGERSGQVLRELAAALAVTEDFLRHGNSARASIPPGIAAATWAKAVAPERPLSELVSSAARTPRVRLVATSSPRRRAASMATLETDD